MAIMIHHTAHVYKQLSEKTPLTVDTLSILVVFIAIIRI